jgi:UDP-N-acetylglucosamine--N-acetylmuramyl-(pentapeptide) pyrophosphoryl-undecaprenol N-acetylglucosamine transferase
MGKSPVEIVKALLTLPVSLWQSLKILKTHGADLVFGVGGYTSPAMLMAAFLRRIPAVILEPNAYPGMANKSIAPFVQRVFLAFDSTRQYFDGRKTRMVGTPVRRAFLQAVGRDSEGAGRAKPHLLIFGGSQGAKAINSAVIEALPLLDVMKDGMTITHQTGEADHARVAAAYEQAALPAQVTPFLYDMPRALQQADLVVSRAGAMTIAELAACEKPAILIPLPTAIYNHQLRNAEVMARAGAAVMIPQAELTGAGLARTITDLVRDPERLQTMSRYSGNMRRNDAAETIVRECYDIIRRRHETSRSGRVL